MLRLFLGALAFMGTRAQTMGYDWNGFSASGLGCGSDSGVLNVGLGQSLPPGATGLKVKQIAFAIYGTNSLPPYIQLHGSTATPRLLTSSAVQCCGTGCDLAVQVTAAGYSWYESPCGRPACANANKWYYMDFSGTAVGTTEQTGISEATFYNAGGSQIGANMINLGSGSVFFMSYTVIIPSPTPTPSLTKSPVSPSLTASETASTSVSRSVTASGSTNPTDSRSVSASRSESRTPSVDATETRTPSRTTSVSRAPSSTISSSRAASLSVTQSRTESPVSPSASPTTDLSLSTSVSATTSSSSSISASTDVSLSTSVTGSSTYSISGSSSPTTSSSDTPSSSLSVSISSSNSMTISSIATVSGSGSSTLTQSQSLSLSATPDSTPSISATASASPSLTTAITASLTMSLTLSSSESGSSSLSTSRSSSSSESISLSPTSSATLSSSVFSTTSRSFSPTTQSFQQVSNTTMSATPTPQFYTTAFPTVTPTYSPTQNATLPIIIVDGQATNMTTTNALLGTTLALIIVAVALAAGRYVPAGWAQRLRRMVPQKTIDDFKRDPLGSVTAMVNDPKSILKSIKIPDSVKSIADMVPKDLKDKFVPESVQNLITSSTATVPHVEADTGDDKIERPSTPEHTKPSRRAPSPLPVEEVQYVPAPIQTAEPEKNVDKIIGITEDSGVNVEATKEILIRQPSTILQINPEDLDAVKALLEEKGLTHNVLG